MGRGGNSFPGCSAHTVAVPTSCTHPTGAGPPATSRMATPGGVLLGVCGHSHLGSNAMLPTTSFPLIFPLFHVRSQKAAAKEDEILGGPINTPLRRVQTNARPTAAPG